jgi:hypothetical protein
MIRPKGPDEESWGQTWLIRQASQLTLTIPDAYR